jgi:hypothetical protein
MQLLAPQVYIDYEINRAPGVPPQPVGIYLNDEGDAPPSINAVVMANSQAMLIEGNTEDGVEGAEKQPEKEEPLKVTFERSVLTVKAKQQPLSVVLYKIANELSISISIMLRLKMLSCGCRPTCAFIFGPICIAWNEDHF